MCMWDVPRVSVRTILTGSHGSARQRAAISLWHLGRTRVALCSRGRESLWVLGGVRLSLGAWKVRKGVMCVCMSVTGTVVCFVYVGLSMTG